MSKAPIDIQINAKACDDLRKCSVTMTEAIERLRYVARYGQPEPIPTTADVIVGAFLGSGFTEMVGS